MAPPDFPKPSRTSSGGVQLSAPLSRALVERGVTAEVVDIDHYRTSGGMAVGTDYVIEVTLVGRKRMSGDGGGCFESFKISKTYSQFRDLAQDVKKAAKSVTGYKTWKKRLNNADAIRSTNSSDPTHRFEVDIDTVVDEIQNSDHSSKGSDRSPSVGEIHVVRFATTLVQMIDSQSVEYFGKVNYNHVKNISKKRRSIINGALDMILSNFPQEELDNPHVRKLTSTIQTFFLRDHVIEEPDQSEEGITTMSAPSESAPPRPMPVSTTTPQSSNEISHNNIVPITQKRRPTLTNQSVQELEAAGSDLVLASSLFNEERIDDTIITTSSSTKQFNHKPSLFQLVDNPMFFLVFIAGCLQLLREASFRQVTFDSDIAILLGFVCFCVGLHMPRGTSSRTTNNNNTTTATLPHKSTNEEGTTRTINTSIRDSRVSFSTPETSPSSSPTNNNNNNNNNNNRSRSAAALLKSSLRKSTRFASSDNGILSATGEVVDESEPIVSPMPKFPDGAKMGDMVNCWSEPSASEFKVRGPNYLKVKKKIHSGPFLFPLRGVDLFLTDACPENVGSISDIMGGKLRQKPTFIINFRLPWGVLLFHFEIPTRFLPFLHASNDPTIDRSKLPNLTKMTPGDRCACRWLLSDTKHKNSTMKIIPSIAQGPWVVKTVVDGKPAIVGKKLSVNYVYQPRDERRGYAEYLEADLDIVADATARKILALVRGYCNSITLDLGFVVQGNNEDELPEQMMGAARIHQMDPYLASQLPPMKDLFSFDV